MMAVSDRDGAATTMAVDVMDGLIVRDMDGEVAATEEAMIVTVNGGIKEATTAFDAMNAFIDSNVDGGATTMAVDTIDEFIARDRGGNDGI